MAGESTSSGSSQGSSQSTSVPISITSPQTDWGLQQSQYYNMIADQLQDFALQKYAKGEGITDQAIADFREMAGDAKGFARRLMDQYDAQIRPAMNQYFREAGSYASAERQAYEAGQAMSTMAQGQRAGTESAINRIAAYGADPNSGRFMSSLAGNLISGAEARAGAGSEAARQTEATGRGMLKDYIGWGQNVPGFAMNAVNAGYAGLTGAENALLGMMNTFPNMMKPAEAARAAAVAANKVPPVGQQSQSTSQQSSQQRSQSQQRDPEKQQQERQPREQQQRQPGQGKGGSGDGDDGYNRGISDVPAGRRSEEDEGDIYVTTRDPGYQGPVPYFDETGTVQTEFDPGTARYDNFGELQGPEAFEQFNNLEQAPNWTFPNSYMPGTGTNKEQGIPDVFNNPFTAGNEANWNNPVWRAPEQLRAADTDPLEAPAAPAASTSGDPWGGQDFGATFSEEDFSEPGGGTNFTGTDDDIMNVDDYNYEDNSYYDEYFDTPNVDDESYYDNTNYEDNSYFEEYFDTPEVDDDSYYDSSGGWDESGGWDDGSYYNEGYAGDDAYYGGGDDSYGYARGGPVRRPPVAARSRPGVVPTTGGAVPRSASPSRGRRTDDITARLNAGEYVIPRDVVKDLGTNHFRKLIEKSRKLRTGMAGPRPGARMKPRLPGASRPTFRSRPMQLPPR